MIFLLGFFISGLCNLINGSCAADLGKQEALKDNKKSLCTVIGVIDGSGALGSAVGSLILSETKSNWGWRDGFWLVISVDIFLTTIPLAKMMIEETKELINIMRNKKRNKSFN